MSKRPHGGFICPPGAGFGRFGGGFDYMAGEFDKVEGGFQLWREDISFCSIPSVKSTLPGYQRQGIASALMAKMMLEAKEKGYQYSILHSSERGKVVYERLGYSVAYWFKRYLLRSKDVGLN